MKSLVTGGAGFIGSHLVRTLVEEGNRVKSIDRNEPMFPVPNVDYIHCPLQFVSRSEYRTPGGGTQFFDEVYHLAAETSLKTRPGTWNLSSKKHFVNNVMATQDLLLGTYDIEKFVFTSSAALYGEGDLAVEDNPDEWPIRCSTPYAYTKAVAERMVQAAIPDSYIFRLGTVVGPVGRTFPNRLVWCALNDIQVKIFNMGKNKRSFVDVRDVCSGLMDSHNYSPGIYNLANVPATYEEVVELVSWIAERYDKKLSYEYTQFCPPNITKTITLDTEKVHLEGWKPKYDIEDSLESVFKWYVEHPDAPEPKETI